jgi:hypothetical protein
MNAPPRTLFILDLNGTLLHRLTKTWESNLAKAHPRYIERDCTVNGNEIFFRPGRRQLLSKLLGIGDVAVWTSAMPKNAVPMVLRTFGGSLNAESLRGLNDTIKTAVNNHSHVLEEEGSGPHTLKFVWTQEDCKIIPVKDEIKPKFKKNLEKVWDLYPQYSANNTVMIDDSPDKLSQNIENLLRLPEYVVTDPKIDFTADKVLYDLSAYVQELAECRDVRDYLKRNPFMHGQVMSHMS